VSLRSELLPENRKRTIKVHVKSPDAKENYSHFATETTRVSMKFKGQALIITAARHPALTTPDLGAKAAVPRSPGTA